MRFCVTLFGLILPPPRFIFWHICSRHAWWTWELSLLLFGLSIHAGAAAQIIEGKASPNHVYKLKVWISRSAFLIWKENLQFQVFIFSAVHCSSFHIGKLLWVGSLNSHSFWMRLNKYIGSPALRQPIMTTFSMYLQSVIINRKNFEETQNTECFYN